MSLFYGNNFYDDPEIFSKYLDRRQAKNNPNDLLELPVIQSLLPELMHKKILDLGCGDGRFCNELLARGADSVVGIDASSKMIDLARSNNSSNLAITFHQATIENYQFPIGFFDIIVSRLVLHYLEKLDDILLRIYASLKKGGSFIFSVEHPCLTAGPTDWVRYRREDADGTWPMDRYFEEGARDVLWMGKIVRKYHRTLETYFTLLYSAGFQVDFVRESVPFPEIVKDAKLLERLRRMPLFLFFRTRKP